MRYGMQIVAAGLLLSQLAGCAMFHNLKPHRLRMLNRGPAPSLDPEFTTMKDGPAPTVLATRDAAERLTVRAQQ
jgi:hypothetical protein